ncbi:transporter substrate-binding domain-containing protein [Tautonia sp. JC769]|uniref:transporter substrate-binding domain-containing protein n=1 Tax=Tautonia sp. JC769 TaxID=3232135 RepID=UPI00345B2A63
MTLPPDASRLRVWLIPPLAVLLATGCGLPLDPKGTLKRARDGTMRVGAVHHPPWVDVRGGGEPEGTEVALVRRLADELGARVEWTVGGETALMHRLERHELDLVVGGITEDTAWRGTIGMSRPHDRDGDQPVILAIAPGENGWLLHLDRWIARRGASREDGP